MLGQGPLGGLSLGQPEEIAIVSVISVATVTISQVTFATVTLEVPGVNVDFSS